MSAAPAPFPPASDRCGICGGVGQPFRKKHGYTILHCRKCGNAYVPSSLVPENLEDIYSRGYFEGEQSTGYPGYLADSELLLQNFRHRLSVIEGLGTRGRRLLDVGAAYGLFLKVARDARWDASGIEIAPDCAIEAAKISGAPVLCGDFATVPVEGQFDVIVMLDVIEHFRDPVGAMRRAYELLAPSGYLVIDTGDIDTPWSRLLGNHWYFLDPPQHLFYFSRRGLVTALREAGFRGDVRVTRPGRSVSLNNALFKLTAAIPSGPLKNGVGRVAKQGVRGSVYLNFGDGMLVAARRE
jgi:SAM-dependent methyltransferase